MQNISFVFSQLGREWVTGLKPAKNVGSHVLGKIEEIIERIDTNGGMLKCIEEGWVQSQIMDSAYKYQREIEEKGYYKQNI